MSPPVDIVSEVLDLLESRWGNEADPPNLRHDEPLDGLILTVLSQHTNDRNRDIAFTRLKERCPSWDDAAAAGYDAVAEAVRPAGLAPTKAARIMEILERVRGDFGCRSLLPLVDWERDEARRYLLSLPGVGGKTAACVLVFDMNLPAFPVDTHVARVCRRLGIVSENASADEICAFLEREVESSRFYGAHLNFIAHGRAVCKARKPFCEECVVSALCSFFRRTCKEG